MGILVLAIFLCVFPVIIVLAVCVRRPVFQDYQPREHSPQPPSQPLKESSQPPRALRIKLITTLKEEHSPQLPSQPQPPSQLLEESPQPPRALRIKLIPTMKKEHSPQPPSQPQPRIKLIPAMKKPVRGFTEV